MAQMKTWTKLAAITLAMALLLWGCDFSTEDSAGTVTLDELQGKPPPSTGGTGTGGTTPPPAPVDPGSLPNNPDVSGRCQQWYFGYKSYDNSYRIRWSNYFATDLGLGPGSYCTVNGEVATFRSYDTDNGCKRPSYTTRGPSSRFNGEVTCILYTPSGQAVGWFKANGDATTQGMLPQ